MLKRSIERIQILKERNMERKGSFIPQNESLRDVAIYRAAADRERTRVEVRAATLHEVVKLANIDIEPDWTLAGVHLLAPVGAAIVHGLAKDWAGREADAEALGLPREEFETARDTVIQWVRPAWGPDAGPVEPEYKRGLGDWGRKDTQMVFWGRGWVENHSIRDFAKVLRIGFGGIRKEVERCIAKADIADPDFPRKIKFWRAALSVCDAGILLGRRYADLAKERARTATCAAEKARLNGIAKRCRRVPERGARTFHEAVQALWFAHILTCGEDSINANSLGRLDQVLDPYYQADIAAGRTTRADALEVLEEFGCRLYLDYDVQAITLGGQTRAGDDGVNDVSYLFLDATETVDVIRDLSIRVHPETPKAFLERASELIVRGGGIPFIFNDACFVKALHDRGLALDDARDYAPIGCIELTVPGRANPHAVSGWFNSLKCLELALFNGLDHQSGDQIGPQTGEFTAMKSMDDLWRAWEQQVDFFAKRMVYNINRGELLQRQFGPLPCWSTLTDDCIPRGRDITDGGAVYNYHSICFLGAPDTADAMMAVRKLVFDDRKLTPAALLKALRGNFAGCEGVRQMLLNEAPKYGNDIAEVDDLAARACNYFIDRMDESRTPLDGRYMVHLFSFLCNLSFGASCGATPDGRHAGEPLAYSLSAHQGRDERGITALLNTLSRLPHDRAAGATAAIVEIDPVLVKGADGPQRLATLIRAALDMGVGQLQWNVTTVERLLKAQQDPEKYGNIPVRVAGYSMLFRLIGKELQDHIIARTKHRC